MNSPTPRLLEKLGEQLRFLERSCAAFDVGCEDEALRLATTLRVLFHNTKMSTSLMTHLGYSEIKMLSSSRGRGDFHDYLSHRLDLSSPEPIKMLPLLGDSFREIPVLDWWSKEPVFSHQKDKFSRKVIVLSAANKDGGAHVDRQLENYYEVLCAGKYTFGITGNLTYAGAPPFQQGVTHYPKNAHLALIRQFAHEALISIRRFPQLQ